MADTEIPTPFSQFCLFKSLSFSLHEYDWFNFVEQWQSMVNVNAPLPEFTYNLVPFFSNARRLVPVFHRYMGVARHVSVSFAGQTKQSKRSKKLGFLKQYG
jgi:hypothetical protein